MTVQRDAPPIDRPGGAARPARVLPLENGDRLTRAEFERRYEAMPQLKKAELIEGVVYVGSPVSAENHGEQDSRLNWWLVSYLAFTRGVNVAANSTVRLDEDNEPQPDALLRVDPSAGGNSRTTAGYVDGAPELVAEVAASNASYDLHQKLGAYRRNGVREYVVWRTLDEALDWFVLREGEYRRLEPDAEGVLRSEVFPGLWLDPKALLAGDLPRVLEVLERGLASPEHAAFVERLAKAAEASRGGGPAAT
jgi:Uma2 family endonuclease